MSSVTQSPISIPEYLKRERVAFEKSEYHCGVVTPRALTSIRHNIITGNIFAHVHEELRDSSACVYTSDLRVSVPPAQFYTYADVMVLGGKPKIDQYDRNTVTNPSVVVEVFSTQTEAYDRGAKFHRYAQGQSLLEYVLVAEHEPHVERRLRRENGEWHLQWYDGLDADLQLATINCNLALSRIYEEVELADDPTDSESSGG